MLHMQISSDLNTLNFTASLTDFASAGAIVYAFVAIHNGVFNYLCYIVILVC